MTTDPAKPHRIAARTFLHRAALALSVPPFPPGSAMPQPPVPPCPAPAIRRAGTIVPEAGQKAGRADGFHQLKGEKARLFNAGAERFGRGIAAGMHALAQSGPVLPLKARSDARFGPAVMPAAAVALAAIGEGQGANLRLAAVGSAPVGGALAVLVGRLHGGRTFRWAPGRQACRRFGHRGRSVAVCGYRTVNPRGACQARAGWHDRAKPTGKDYRT